MMPSPLDVSLCVLLTALGACSRPASLSARDAADANDTGQANFGKSAGERDVLQRLPHLPNGAPQQIGGLVVTASAPYAAASGRTCRSLELSMPSSKEASRRLACSNGNAWFFVPDVFEGSVAE
jgi:hypothetical protein